MDDGGYASRDVVFLGAAFVIATVALAWVYAGYPAAVAIAARLRPLRLAGGGAAATVTVAIAVHDESAQIAERVEDALAQDGHGSPVVEVLVGSDGSGDGTDALVEEIARTDPRVRLLVLPRAGQTPTQPGVGPR